VPMNEPIDEAVTDPPLGQGRYLFAVARGLDAAALSGTAGLRGAPLEVVEHQGLRAVVCTVDLGEFGEEQLASNLEDLAWLEEVARAHNEVVFAAASAGTVAPMRLVTICSDDASVRERIADLHDALAHALDRVEGRREWSVKVYAARQEQPDPVATTRPSSGAEYLQRKREQAAQRRSSGDASLQVAEEINQALTRASVAARVLPPQDPRLTGRSDTMVLNGAYLVPAEEGDGFHEVVRRLGEHYASVQLEVEGPWPPYSFATLD
jgi:Gas vesicle synthesis protein GvpL/GvpF